MQPTVVFFFNIIFFFVFKKEKVFGIVEYL